MPVARLALPLLALALAACSTPGPGRHDRPERGDRPAPNARAEALRAGAYRPPQEASLSVSLQTWAVAGDALPVSLAFPGGSERGLPLIVYLPGLGESAQAGAALRHAWARAGFAVLGVQPLAADEHAWSSELARGADFRALARERREPAQQAARTRLLQAVLDEARRRSVAGDSLWQRVDFSRLGLAGFDIGAPTALALPDARARLAISPPGGAAAGGPVLVIASRRDSDPLTGEPLAPRARELFESPGLHADSALLMFDGISHAGLGGQAEAESQAQERGERATRAMKGGGGEGGGGRGGKGGSGRQRGGGGGGGGGGGPMSGGASPEGAASPGRGPGNAEGETAAIAITAASTAFWDAALRSSPAARAWLQREASPWLRGLADWQAPP